MEATKANFSLVDRDCEHVRKIEYEFRHFVVGITPIYVPLCLQLVFSYFVSNLENWF